MKIVIITPRVPEILDKGDKLRIFYQIKYLSISNDIHLIKDAPIPAGSALQILDGGAKVVMQSGDALKVKSNTASSADVWVSVVDAIST